MWAQALDPETKQPTEAAFPVYHPHRFGLSLTGVNPAMRSLCVGPDRLILSLLEQRGNLWLLDDVSMD